MFKYRYIYGSSGKDIRWVFIFHLVFLGLPVVEITPTTYNTAIGDQVTIHCNIVSDSAGVNEVYWQTTSNNQLRLIYNGDIGYQGSTPTTPSLTINFASINDTGTYTCHATNDQGTGNSNTGNVTVTGGKY